MPLLTPSLSPCPRYKRQERKELTTPRPVLRGEPPNPAMLNPIIESNPIDSNLDLEVSYARNSPARRSGVDSV